MNIEQLDGGKLIVIIFKFAFAFFCLLHLLFVLYVVRQVINLDNLLSTLRRSPIIIFGFIHAIILIIILIFICILPQ